MTSRQDALKQAREVLGELGMISSGEETPHFIWEIGNMPKTIVRGNTWAEAVENLRKKHGANDHFRA